MLNNYYILWYFIATLDKVLNETIAMFFCFSVWCTKDSSEQVTNYCCTFFARTSHYNHIISILHQLLWLRVQYRTKYIILTRQDSTNKALYNISSTYFKQLLEVYKQNRALKSKEQVIPKSRTVTYEDCSCMTIACSEIC